MSETVQQRLADLVEFARLEVASADIEPWAATIAAMTDPAVVGADAVLDPEQALWVAALYNTTDDILSALKIRALSPTLAAWTTLPPRAREIVAGVPLSTERRNLYGGRILDRLDSHAEQVGPQTQRAWIDQVIYHRDCPQANFPLLMTHLRRVWGVGRLAAFEWAEFLNKVAGVPVETTDGALWESSGPRESLERIYGQTASGPGWLSGRAEQTKAILEAEGVPLSWWDFETVICDFNVMVKGRYYPGKHLAMISEEIANLPEAGGWRAAWTAAFRSVVPAPWRDLPPGVSKDLCRAYARTGTIHTPLPTLTEA